jgi:hypothetical protein
MLANLDLDEPGAVRRGPPAIASHFVLPRSAQQVRAGADETPFAQSGASDHGVRADVDTFLDEHLAVGEQGAEPDRELDIAALQRKPVERTAEEQAGRARQDREDVRPEPEYAFSARVEPLFNPAGERGREDEREGDRVDPALMAATT